MTFTCNELYINFHHFSQVGLGIQLLKDAKDAYNTQGFSYDIYSIMHYPSWVDVKCSGLTNMTPVDTSIPVSDMGAQHPDGTFSEKDVLHINTFYNCEFLLPGH